MPAKSYSNHKVHESLLNYRRNTILNLCKKFIFKLFTNYGWRITWITLVDINILSRIIIVHI